MHISTALIRYWQEQRGPEGGRRDVRCARCKLTSGCWVFARAHAKAGDAIAISGYLGSGGQFDEAIGDFSLAYADQAKRDHAALKAAVRKRRITAYQEE